MRAVKVSTLIGPALDWAVAKAMGKETWRAASGKLHLVYRGIYETEVFQPSVRWAQGGPIIERETIGLFFDRACGNQWRANHITAPYQLGPTPLVAAMRCYVASKLGDEVEIPEELL
jgi:hypothetical protein